jgi:hypothetical protein
VEDARELHGDVAAAHDEDARRQAVQVEGLGGEGRREREPLERAVGESRWRERAVGESRWREPSGESRCWREPLERAVVGESRWTEPLERAIRDRAVRERAVVQAERPRLTTRRTPA